MQLAEAQDCATAPQSRSATHQMERLRARCPLNDKYHVLLLRPTGFPGIAQQSVSMANLTESYLSSQTAANKKN